MPTKQNYNSKMHSKKMSLEATWLDLEAGIKQIYNGQRMTSKRYLQLYTHVYNFCTNVRQLSLLRKPTTFTSTAINRSRSKKMQQNQTEGAQIVGLQLYNRIKSFLQDHLVQFEGKPSDLMDEDLLTFYTVEWEKFKFSSKVFNGVCGYLNRQWFRRMIEEQQKDIYEIYQLAVVTWRENFLMKFKVQITNAVLKMIENERNGIAINSSFISGVTKCFIEMGLDSHVGSNLKFYQENFEQQFLVNSNQFYKTESENFLSKNPVIEYMKHVEKRLTEEKNRVQLYLHESTQSKLASVCATVLIQNHLEVLCDEFPNLLDSDKNEDLARIFMLLSQTDDGLTKLKDYLEKHIQIQGQQAIEKIGQKAMINPKVYIKTILEIHSKFNSLLIITEFGNDRQFVAAFDKACNNFINVNSVTKKGANESRSSELLANYCDILLKKSRKNSEQAELEDSLNHVMIVFEYLTDKDAFQQFYSKLLAKRLVLQTSASDEAEAAMVLKLKQACGIEYTRKLQKMLQDIDLNKDLNEKYKRFLLDNQRMNRQIDFSVQVLNSGSWPFAHQNNQFRLPMVLEQSVQSFNSFYVNLHSGRKLNWVYGLCKGELATNFCFESNYILQANTFQMAVLLQFNEQTEWTFQQLIENVGGCKDNLQQILGVLMKTKLLNCDVDENQLIDDSKISLNILFKTKKQRINIDRSIKAVQKVEQETTHQCIEEDHRMSIQAAIVRIMKNRKIMSYTQLLSEVLNQLSSRFNPKVRMIKKCIDSLIEREYLERIEGQMDTYSYVA